MCSSDSHRYSKLIAACTFNICYIGLPGSPSLELPYVKGWGREITVNPDWVGCINGGKKRFSHFTLRIPET